MKKFLAIIAISQLMIAAAHAAPDIVVIVNPAGANLTKEQVSDLFLGKIKIGKPLDLPSSTPVKSEFYEKVTGHDLSQVKATWSRLLFTGQAQPPKELADPAAVKKAVAADPKAVGYIAKSDVDSTVKVILELQ
jgi:ABC-type phosphate transport system substrate-binding protein